MAEPGAERVDGGPSTLGLWVAWVLYIGVTTCGGVLGGGPVGVTAIGAMWPILVFVMSRTMRVVEPSPCLAWTRAETAGETEPWPLAWPLFGIAVVLGVWPAGFAMGRPETYSYYPLPQLFVGGLLGLLPFLVLQMVCWLRASAAARRAWWIATLAVLTTHAAWVSTFGLQVLFALHYPLFEAARLDALRREGPGVEGWVEDARIGLFRFDAVGQTASHGGSGALFFAAEACPWPQYTAASLRGSGWTRPHMCFAGAAGSGFYWAEPGTAIPPLNQSAYGRLVGGWWWYVDD